MKTMVNRPFDRAIDFLLPHVERFVGEVPRPGSAAAEAWARKGVDAGQASPPLPMRLNAAMLMMDFVASSAFGYPFWILAARLFDPADVGLGSAVLSAMRLCSLLALIGIGSAVILLLPRREQHTPSDVLSSAFTLAVGTGLVISIGFLLLSSAFFPELGKLASSPIYIVTFLVLNLVVVVIKTFDSTFLALRRADKVALRSVVQGVVALAILGVLGFAAPISGALAILIAFIVGLLASCLLGRTLLRTALPGLRMRLRASRATTGAMVGVGLPNFALKLAFSMPANAVPLVVTEVLSPASNAYWRAVWMFGLLVTMVPSASSSALFAEGSNRPEMVDKQARQGIRFSLLLGIPLAGATALLAGVGLSLMGEGYAAAGTTPLRIIVITVIPQTFIAAYVARQRVAQRLIEPTMFGTLSSAISIGGAVIGGTMYGLTGIAVAWLVAQCLSGSFAAWKLRHLYGKGPNTSTTLNGIGIVDEPSRKQFARQGD